MGTPRPKAHVYAVAAQHAIAEVDPRIAEVRRRLGVTPAGSEALGDGDFDWAQASLVEYEQHTQAQEQDQLIVAPPATAEHPTERTYLISPTSAGQPFGGIGFMRFERDDETRTDQYRVQFVDPSGRPVVGISIDESLEQADPIYHQQPAVTTQASYWGCMQTCLETLWPTLPWPIKIVASAACGSCLFGGFPAGCAGCVGALGGYAVNCMKKCEHLG
ncbi:hypothetical protein [Parasphingorhabdus pacifica]